MEMLVENLFFNYFLRTLDNPEFVYFIFKNIKHGKITNIIEICSTSHISPTLSTSLYSVIHAS